MRRLDTLILLSSYPCLWFSNKFNIQVNRDTSYYFWSRRWYVIYVLHCFVGTLPQMWYSRICPWKLCRIWLLIEACTCSFKPYAFLSLIYYYCEQDPLLSIFEKLWSLPTIVNWSSSVWPSLVSLSACYLGHKIFVQWKLSPLQFLFSASVSLETLSQI